MDEKKYTDMFSLFKKGGKPNLEKDHYELAEEYPAYSSDDWRYFLQDPKASLYIGQEFALIRQAELRKIMSGISDDTKSVGRAQILNALASQNEKESNKKEGPVFVYNFIPPSSEQLKAPNVRVIDYLEAKRLGLVPAVISKAEEDVIERPKGDKRWSE